MSPFSFHIFLIHSFIHSEVQIFYVHRSDWWILCLLYTRHRKLPSLPETSGDDEDKSEEEDESSSRISSVGTCVSHPRSCPTLHGNTSPALQASTIQLPSSEVTMALAFFYFTNY